MTIAKSFNRRKILLSLTACVSLALVAACSASSVDYKTEGEKFLESESLAESVGYLYTDAQCDEPGSTEVGTQYACSATRDDGTSWELILEIIGDSQFMVVGEDIIE